MAGEDPRFVEWVRLQSCLMAADDGGACWGPIEADHVGDRGYGKRAHDRTCVPLCRGHHRARTDIKDVFGRMARIERKEWCERAIAETQALYARTHQTPCGETIDVPSGTFRCHLPRAHTGQHRGLKPGGFVEWPNRPVGASIGEVIHRAGRPPSSMLREALADYAHTTWAEGIRQIVAWIGDLQAHEQATVIEWQRRAATPYADLPEEEKAIARREADRIIAVATKAKEAR